MPPERPADPDETARIPDIAHVHDLRGDVWLTPRQADKARRFVDASADLLGAVDGLLRRDGGRLEHLARIAAEVQRLAGEDDQAARALADELARIYAAAEQLRAAGGLLPDELRAGTEGAPRAS